ncbi:hypothetical protein Tco_0052996 [Tanacetum coccineum]
MSFNHDKCVVKSVKFVKKPPVKKVWRVKQVQQVWQATGNLFTNGWLSVASPTGGYQRKNKQEKAISTVTPITAVPQSIDDSVKLTILLNAACKKALNLFKKGLLIRGEAVEASKRRRGLLDHKIQQLSKGSSEGYSIIPESIRVILKYHSEYGNPARANIKQALGRTSRTKHSSFQDQERYEHVSPQDTRSHDGERPQADDQRLDLADDLKESQDHISSFSIDNEVLENLTKQVALLAQQYKTQFPQTNNQLRTSSNKRNQATVQNGNKKWGSSEQSCGQDNEVDEDVDEPQVQDLALSVDNMFHDDDCDAFDSDVDEAPTAQTMFMANLSSADPVYDEASPSYDSDILSEVPDHDNYQDAVCEHHEVHEMHDEVQPNYVVESHDDYTSDSNMILYDQYVKDNAVPVV